MGIFYHAAGQRNATTLVTSVDIEISIKGAFLIALNFLPVDDGEISIGTSPGGNELSLEPTTITGGIANSIAILKDFTTAATIYITGISSLTTIKVISI